MRAGDSLILGRVGTRNQGFRAGAFEWVKGYKMLDIGEIEDFLNPDISAGAKATECLISGELSIL